MNSARLRLTIAARPAAACILALGAMAAPARAQSDSTWRDHNRAADAAMARGDWADARAQLRVMDDLLGGHPGVAVALARVALRSGDTAAAIAQARRVAAMGVVTRGFGDTTFAGLRGRPDFEAAAAAIAANVSPFGGAQPVAEWPDSAALAEDLVWDAARRRFIVSDVRRHRLWSVSERGVVATFGEAQPPGWAMLGLALDAQRGVLWATAVTLPQALGWTSADSGRAAILRLEAATGAVQRRYDLPAPSRAAPGDLLVAENGDLFSGDGQTGAVYVIRAGGDSLETLVPAGRLRGTQQPALAPDGRTIFLPDYGRGIARVDRVSGAVTWLRRPDDVTLTGIDGLVWDGRGLIAVQNGVTPARVVRLTLDAALGAVERAEILLRDTRLADDPTHAVVVEGTLFVIGHAGWAGYNDDGTPVAGALRPPVLLRLPLRR